MMCKNGDTFANFTHIINIEIYNNNILPTFSAAHFYPENSLTLHLFTVCQSQCHPSHDIMHHIQINLLIDIISKPWSYLLWGQSISSNPGKGYKYKYLILTELWMPMYQKRYTLNTIINILLFRNPIYVCVAILV